MSQTNGHTCPWWLIPTFDNPLRRWVHRPQQILGSYVRPGDRVLDVGCGMGYFTLPLARLAGPTGRVVAADLQPQMLEGLRRRAEKAGLLGQIQMVQCSPERIGVAGPLDFALAFWMVHEVRKPEPFLAEIRDALKPGGQLLVIEPVIHVTERAFEQTLTLAQGLGFRLEQRPHVRVSRAALLCKETG